MGRTTTYTLSGIDEADMDPGDKIYVKVASVTLHGGNLQIKLQRIPEPQADYETRLRQAVGTGERDDTFDWLKGMAMSNLVIADKIGALFDELCKTNRQLANINDTLCGGGETHEARRRDLPGSRS